MKSRIGKASYTFKILEKIWKASNISEKTKIRIFNTNVKSVLLHGCETWKINKTTTKMLQTFINRCLRRILKIFWPTKKENTELWQRTGQEEIGKTIKRKTWRWIGHTLRKPESDITRQSLDWNPTGKRKRGRPKDTWRRSINRDIERCCRNWGELKKEAKNRTRWRCSVEALCSI